MAQKRQREEGKPADASASDKQQGSGGKATLGQQTSHIKNKLVRAELYAKLKHKQKVSQTVAPYTAAAACFCFESLAARIHPRQFEHQLPRLAHPQATVAQSPSACIPGMQLFSVYACR
jgi:hypothetical protein